MEAARAKDAKERMAGVERLHQLLEASRKPLSSAEVTSLLDCCLDLLKDSNFRISQGALQCLASAAVLSGHHFKLHLDALVPPAVERLGDGKQPVRDAARHLLLTLMEISSPTIIVERAGTYAWTHKSWKVREEYARTVTSAIGLFASTELPLQRAILPPILQMLSNSNHGVQEAAISCIEEMYTQVGPQFRDELQRHHLPMSVLKDINSRLERIEPKVNSSDGLCSNYSAVEIKPASLNPKRSSSKAKSSTLEVSLFRGDCDITEKPVDPVKVYSEKELIREIEKIASILVPDKDWSLRIGAMQRVEGLVIGGAADYPCFRGLMKHLVGPLSTQLSDRRSTIVKQACHLLNFLSKELLGDFEACAEVFILILFKLVVITVLVIAESADNCIKTMLRNCKVVRVLPHIADSAKNDRSFILRARCCEYALLILEYWADEPEIQRAADLYEDLIKCCVADAMSEVRATARTCYRMFTKTWPERSRQLFLSFDPVIQRVINEENGSIHRRHASPSHRDRSSQISLNLQTPAPSNLSGYGTSAIVAMEKSSSLASGVDPPSSRDPPFPLALPASHNLTTSFGVDATSFGMSKGNTRNGALGMPDIVTQIQASKDSSKLSYCNTVGAEPLSALSYHSAKRAPEKLKERGFYEETSDSKEVHRPFTDVNFGESQNSYVPNFQRPLLKKNAVGRMSASRRRSFDDSQLLLGDMSSFVVAPASLNDTLSEGLNPSSDWNTRVAAFNYLRSLLQQGPKGIQEVTQNFEKVMKLFFQHLDDPHHKVAQAALLTLSKIIPACRKPFESYMDRILPRVFLRLIDPKELVRQPCSTTLEIVGKSYGVDSLLPALLRSLDEQRSPKAKLAVIQFAISSFNKHPMNSESFGNSGILKLWLAKLTSLAHDKNIKLKEAAVSCIISVYSHYDSVAVLNFILSLSVEEQNSLRRVIKQFTPRIEVDLINFMQNKKERPRPKSYDPSDVGTYAEEGYSGLSRKNQAFGRYSAGSVDNTGGQNWSSEQEPMLVKGSIGQVASDETQLYSYQNSGNCVNIKVLSSETKDLNCIASSVDYGVKTGASSTPRLDMNGLVSSNYMGVTAGIQHDNDALPELDLYHSKLAALKLNSARDTGVSIPQILHLICNGNDENPTIRKRGALQQLVEASVKNDHSIWAKYFNQILTVVLEVLDDSESSIRELALSLIFGMLRNQKDAMEDSIEIIIEKLLHVTKDVGPKVADEAEQCLTHVLSQYDPFRCLSVIIPLLVTEDEKTLITCINCITKLVGRLSQEELTSHLPSFLPALFEAFGNQSADVRKTVVFCLVDIYIILGKAFLPHLEGLNSTQLRLVTIYANRISQARTGTIIDANHS